MKLNKLFVMLLIGVIGVKAGWTPLFQEDFETGVIPPGWTVIDANGDGYSWVVGTTGDIDGYAPPNYGTAYAYYSDDDAGSSAPASDEQLITPSIALPSVGSLRLIYGWGIYTWSADDYLVVKARFFSGGSWGTWDTIATHYPDANGQDTIDLSSFLPAESLQVMFEYIDSGGWNWAVAVDNVSVEGVLSYNLTTTQIVEPQGAVSRFSAIYPEMEVTNTGANDATYDAYFEIYDSLFLNLLYADTLTGNTLLTGNKDTLHFNKIFNPPYDGWYNAKAYVVYTLDQYPPDDTLVSQFYVYTPQESLIESFEEDTFPPLSWTLNGAVSWRQGPYYGDNIVEPSYAYDGTRYASFPSFNTYAGLSGELVSPFVYLNPANGTPGVFFWGWNRGTSNNDDTLKLYVSTDGINWNLLQVISGNYEKWFAFDLSAYANQTIQVKFVGISDDGTSNIVVDYVKIGYGTNVREGVYKNEEFIKISPLSKNLDVKLFTKNVSDLNLLIYSINGRKVDVLKMQNIKGYFNYRKNLPAGIYMIKGNIGKKEMKSKIIIVK